MPCLGDHGICADAADRKITGHILGCHHSRAATCSIHCNRGILGQEGRLRRKHSLGIGWASNSVTRERGEEPFPRPLLALVLAAQ